jgi:hypothetical protein
VKGFRISSVDQRVTGTDVTGTRTLGGLPHWGLAMGLPPLAWRRHKLDEHCLPWRGSDHGLELMTVLHDHLLASNKFMLMSIVSVSSVTRCDELCRLGCCASWCCLGGCF